MSRAEKFAIVKYEAVDVIIIRLHGQHSYQDSVQWVDQAVYVVNETPDLCDLIIDLTDYQGTTNENYLKLVTKFRELIGVLTQKFDGRLIRVAFIKAGVKDLLFDAFKYRGIETSDFLTEDGAMQYLFAWKNRR